MALETCFFLVWRMLWVSFLWIRFYLFLFLHEDCLGSLLPSLTYCEPAVLGFVLSSYIFALILSSLYYDDNVLITAYRATFNKLSPGWSVCCDLFMDWDNVVIGVVKLNSIEHQCLQCSEWRWLCANNIIGSNLDCVIVLFKKTIE